MDKEKQRQNNNKKGEYKKKKNVNRVLIPLSASSEEALKVIKKHFGIDEEKHEE